MGYNDEEYRSPRASKQYTSPKNKRKRKTKGQQLEESGEYLQDPETQDTSKPLESRMFDIDPKKHKEKQRQKKIEDLSKRPGTSAEGEAAKRKLKRPEDLPNFLQVTDPQAEELAEYDRLMRESKDLEGQERIDKIKEANRSRPNYGKMIMKPIQMLGDAFEWVDDQAGIPGTKIDVKHARNLITDPLDRLHPIAGLVGEILVPDTTDLLAGSGYVKRITTNTPALIRAIKKTALNFDNRILQNGYEAASGVVRTVKSLAGGDSIVGNIGTGLDKAIKKTTNTLDPKGLRNWGSDRRISGAKFITGNKIQDKDSFMQAGWQVLANLNKNFGIDINRAISPIQIHHKGVIRQIAESANGLTDEGAKLAGDYISKRVGFKMGYDATNAAPLPPKFHQRVHDIINDSISGQWGDNLEGLVQKLGLPPNWQTTMDLQARIDAGIYDEIADAINKHVDVIDKFWNSVATRTNLGKLSSDEFIDATFEVLEADSMLTNLRRTRSLSPETGYTITQAVNELLEKAGRIDLQSPIFDKLTPEMTKEAYKFALQNNGWKALKEVLTTGQDSATVFKAYGIKTKGFEEVLTQLGIPGLSKSKELGTGSFLGRPKGSKTSKSKLQKQQKKKYDEDPDIKQKPPERDETKPMDPPPEKD